ncbi:MAG: thiolase family protein [Deltaproteobacteria bacterium]|nr:thiolase family protein [Deltaproteobacteria bacterium]
MRMKAVIAGTGMTSFGKHADTGLKALGAAAVTAALQDAGIAGGDLEAAFVGNAAAGVVTGQESIRGQVILRSIGIGKIPVVNVENACGGGSTALQQACAMVSAGCYDVVLALGVEKLYHPDRARIAGAFAGAVDVEASLAAAAQGSGGAPSTALFMELYAGLARDHMARYGTTVQQFAAVASKTSFHGSLNPRAQFREALSVEEVLATPMIAAPLTRAMCSPIGDGAAAVVIVSESKARQLGLQDPVRVVTNVLRSGWDHGADEETVSALCAREAYADAGVGPQDLDVIECHDACAPSELMVYGWLGLCTPAESGRFVESGATRLGGRLPVNTSGGLLRKGHPLGATGAAQIVELREQLLGRCGQRQVEGARVALAHNGGGMLGPDAAAMCVTILSRG